MKTQNEMNRWTICKECAGRGKKKQRIKKSVKIRYEKALEEFKNSADYITVSFVDFCVSAIVISFTHGLAMTVSGGQPVFRH